jgi:hypothetical protein
MDSTLLLRTNTHTQLTAYAAWISLHVGRLSIHAHAHTSYTHIHHADPLLCSSLPRQLGPVRTSVDCPSMHTHIHHTRTYIMLTHCYAAHCLGSLDQFARRKSISEGPQLRRLSVIDTGMPANDQTGMPANKKTGVSVNNETGMPVTYDTEIPIQDHVSTSAIQRVQRGMLLPLLTSDNNKGTPMDGHAAPDDKHGQGRHVTYSTGQISGTHDDGNARARTRTEEAPDQEGAQEACHNHSGQNQQGHHGGGVGISGGERSAFTAVVKNHHKSPPQPSSSQPKTDENAVEVHVVKPSDVSAANQVIKGAGHVNAAAGGGGGGGGGAAAAAGAVAGAVAPSNHGNVHGRDHVMHHGDTHDKAPHHGVGVDAVMGQDHSHKAVVRHLNQEADADDDSDSGSDGAEALVKATIKMLFGTSKRAAKIADLILNLSPKISREKSPRKNTQPSPKTGGGNDGGKDVLHGGKRPSTDGKISGDAQNEASGVYVHGSDWDSGRVMNEEGLKLMHVANEVLESLTIMSSVCMCLCAYICMCVMFVGKYVCMIGALDVR